MSVCWRFVSQRSCTMLRIPFRSERVKILLLNFQPCCGCGCGMCIFVCQSPRRYLKSSKIDNRELFARNHFKCSILSGVCHTSPIHSTHSAKRLEYMMKACQRKGRAVVNFTPTCTTNAWISFNSVRIRKHSPAASACLGVGGRWQLCEMDYLARIIGLFARRYVMWLSMCSCFCTQIFTQWPKCCIRSVEFQLC